MYNLDDKISRWREKLIVSQDLQEEVADELEDHLRQKIDELNDSGLSDEDKFILAKTRIGHPSSLCSEFEKLNGYSQRLRRVGYIIGGYLLIDTALKLIQLAAKIAFVLSPSSKSIVDTATTATTVYIITGTALILALFYGLWQSTQKESFVQNSGIVQKFIAVRRKYPRYTICAMLFALLSLTFINHFGVPLFMASYMSSMRFGHIMVRMGVYTMTTTSVIPLLLLVFLLWIIRTNSTMQRQINQ